MAVHRIPLQQRRMNYAAWQHGFRRRVRDPLSTPRALALGLVAAILLWVMIVAALGAL